MNLNNICNILSKVIILPGKNSWNKKWNIFAEFLGCTSEVEITTKYWRNQNHQIIVKLEAGNEASYFSLFAWRSIISEQYRSFAAQILPIIFYHLIILGINFPLKVVTGKKVWKMPYEFAPWELREWPVDHVLTTSSQTWAQNQESYQQKSI